MYQYKLESQVKDRLVFVHSELSPHYYSSARFKAAFFQRETEPISDGTSYFHGTGRFNVFHIVNPSPNLRVIVDFSRTSLGEGRTKLPRRRSSSATRTTSSLRGRRLGPGRLAGDQARVLRGPGLHHDRFRRHGPRDRQAEDRTHAAGTGSSSPWTTAGWSASPATSRS
jgi:hypothetical protein